MRLIACTTGAAFWAASAFAGCGAGMVQVLACDTSASKQLQVCIGQGKARYAFGPKGAPELVMTQPLGQVQGQPWQGVGRSVGEGLTFENNGVSYSIYISFDRGDIDAPARGGVTVMQDDQTLARLQCRKGSAVISMFSISDGFRDAGFCWDRTTQKYTRSCS